MKDSSVANMVKVIAGHYKLDQAWLHPTIYCGVLDCRQSRSRWLSL